MREIESAAGTTECRNEPGLCIRDFCANKNSNSLERRRKGMEEGRNFPFHKQFMFVLKLLTIGLSFYMKKGKRR